MATGIGGGDNNGLDDETTMFTILAKMNDMQNEMNGMKNRLSSMDELEKKYKCQEEECSLLKANCNELEKKCTHLETRCESLQRSVQILSKESKWEYTAPPIPLSHWRGFDEGYIEEIKSLLSDIKRYTCELRRGKVLEDINFGPDALLQHDNLLLPHWRELANALQLYQYNGSIPELSITNIQLPSAVLDLLAPALKGKLLTGFVLDNNDFEEDAGVKFATKCIKSNNELHYFNWVSNQINDTEDAKLLVASIINHPSIDKVQLENCLCGDVNSYELVRPLFASDKIWDLLDLERNNIITEGDTTIPDYITSNPPLNYLYLEGNKLNDEDAILIANALKKNTNLKDLRLGDNDITDIGKEALLKAVYDPTSLNSMSDCNHTCRIDLDGIDRGLPLYCRNIPLGKRKSKRSMKIHYVISLRHREGSNVRHLNAEFEDKEEDSLKLVPYVLECVQKTGGFVSSDSIHPLSIMYEVLRGWKMPELYEKRS